MANEYGIGVWVMSMVSRTILVGWLLVLGDTGN